MKTKFFAIATFLLFLFSLTFTESYANPRNTFVDTTCCKPDSLKVVSTNFPTFCVSWQISADSNCITPYGFEVEWRPFPSASPWNNQTVIYSGGTTINFCGQVLACGNYQWRVRTICDTAGVTSYSDWVYGNKFAMANCFAGDLEKPIDHNKRNQTNDKSGVSVEGIKPKGNNP